MTRVVAAVPDEHLTAFLAGQGLDTRYLTSVVIRHEAGGPVYIEAELLATSERKDGKP